MEHSKRIKFYEQLEKQGKVTPLVERPALDFINSWYINVFAVLSNSRIGGIEGRNPIQVSEMLCYFDHFDIIDTADDFITIIQAMDATYLKHHQNDAEDKREEVKKARR